MKNLRVVANILILLGIVLSTYFLNASLTPDGYTGRVLWFTYDVHSPRNPAIVIGVLVLALLIINWTAVVRSRHKLRIISMAIATMAILATVFFYLSFKRHNRMPWERPNILIIDVDTLRADFVSAYGAGLAKTPNIDSLAEDGWLFEKAYSHIPITMPSHSSLFSGRMPHEIWVLNNTDDFNYPEPTLAEILKSEGYTTGAVVSLGVLRARHKLNRGFDYYNDTFPRNGRWYNYGEVVTDRGISWLEKNAGKEKPFFLWLHFQDPHEPYCPPTPEYSDDTEVLLNGEPVATGNLDSAEFISAPLRLEPGSNKVLIRKLRGKEHKQLYFTSIYFAGIDDNKLPDDWQDLLRRHTNRDRGRMLRKLQEPRFLTNFNGFEFSGLSFSEGAGWSKPIARAARPRREVMNSGAEMVIVNNGVEAKEVTLRLKGGVNKGTSTVWRDYAAEVEYNDAQVGRLLDYLKQSDLMDNTIIVFMSDHGEELNENGVVGHIHDLYTQDLHIPLIIRDPDSERKGVRTDRLARIIDIAPTILDMAGLHKPAYMEGRTLLEHILRNRSKPRKLYAETFREEARHDRVGILEDNYLLILSPNLERLRQLELFDLSRDENQWINLALSGSGGRLNRMANNARAYWQSMNLVRSDEEIDDDRREMLSDLGYIQGGSPTDSDTSAERGEPDAGAVERALQVLNAFKGWEISTKTLEPRRSGGDGPFYLYAEVELKAEPGSLKWAMMALRDYIGWAVLPLLEPFPVHLRVFNGGKMIFDKIIAEN